MGIDAFKVVRDFEAALCDYTGAPLCVTTTSCTMAILLAVAYHVAKTRWLAGEADLAAHWERPAIEIPRRTYCGVPMAITHAGGRPIFDNRLWIGSYDLRPLPVRDSARLLTSGMCARLPLNTMTCVSFHPTKHLGLANGGGAILHDDLEADAWLRRARFDGRAEGVAPKDDHFQVVGWHAYMMPATAAEGLQRLAALPAHNEPLPWGPGTTSDYPDLSAIQVFQ